MNLPVFKLEDYLSQHEFNVPLLLCCSDAETFSMKEVLDMTNAHERAMWDNLALGYSESREHAF